ncbi:unnamed protein product [Oppiella nova]|uniref:Uncharacterized protein n=1 Tax=Oppiella nova TaxID=334625 RepID=A0A7R9QGS6_9ACAR|nr:unnamed protein product [Oppiella nova]CAG2165556.1 unnamed protein product [Oppiella nova]
MCTTVLCFNDGKRTANTGASGARYGTVRTNEISDAGAHILYRINEARKATPDNIYSNNLTRTEVEEGIKKVVAIFNEVTANFESQGCLSRSEEKMRDWVYNCYYVIVDRIISGGVNQVMVGEGAYIWTEPSVNRVPVPGYQFQLGPLFIRVTKA